MIDSDKAKYPVAAASERIGVHPGTARSWIQKGWIRLSARDRAAKVPGATTLLSGRRVLQLAIASSAVAMGVHPEHACAAARHFTDIGDGKRAPGDLFGAPFTALVIYSDGVPTIVNADDTTLLREVFFPSDPVAHSTGPRREVAAILMLDFIVKRVEIALDKFDRGEVEG